MAIIDIPTGNLPYITVEELPASGETNTIYGVPQDEEGFLVKDYRWYNGAWEEVDLGANIFGFLFADYQESVSETVAEMEDTILTLDNKVTEQAALIQELEEAVFPTITVSFDMNITSMIMTELDLMDSEGNVVEANAFATEIWESEPMTFQTELKKDHFYYLRNSDGYALSRVSPSGVAPVVLVTNGEEQINLGNVEIAVFEPQYPQERGGEK